MGVCWVGKPVRGRSPSARSRRWLIHLCTRIIITTPSSSAARWYKQPPGRPDDNDSPDFARRGQDGVGRARGGPVWASSQSKPCGFGRGGGTFYISFGKPLAESRCCCCPLPPTRRSKQTASEPLINFAATPRTIKSKCLAAGRARRSTDAWLPVCACAWLALGGAAGGQSGLRGASVEESD